MDKARLFDHTWRCNDLTYMLVFWCVCVILCLTVLHVVTRDLARVCRVTSFIEQSRTVLYFYLRNCTGPGGMWHIILTLFVNCTFTWTQHTPPLESYARL